MNAAQLRTFWRIEAEAATTLRDFAGVKSVTFSREAFVRINNAIEQFVADAALSGSTHDPFAGWRSIDTSVEAEPAALEVGDHAGVLSFTELTSREVSHG